MTKSDKGKDAPNDESVESGSLGDFRRRGSNEMLFLDFSSDGVLVSEDEVNLLSGTASIGAKHDGAVIKNVVNFPF